MVLYFSGTGNSRYAAELIGGHIGDQAVCINSLLHNGSPALHSESPFIFVCPVYAWRMPRVLDAFIRNTQFSGNRNAYFVLTCGDSAGNAAGYAKKLCEEKSLLFMGMAEIVMPDNYIALYNTPEKEKCDSTLRNAKPAILQAAEQIKSKSPFPARKPSFFGKAMSGIMNPLFYGIFVSAKGFYSTENCTGCKKCAAACPLGNISMTEKRPQWGKNCTHCMACISRCPKEAVEYKSKTKGRRRYHIENTAFYESESSAR